VDLKPSVLVTATADPATGRVAFTGDRACLGDPELDKRFRLSLSADLHARARRRPAGWPLGALRARIGGAAADASASRDGGAHAWPGERGGEGGGAAGLVRRAGGAGAASPLDRDAVRFGVFVKRGDRALLLKIGRAAQRLSRTHDLILTPAEAQRRTAARHFYERLCACIRFARTHLTRTRWCVCAG